MGKRWGGRGASKMECLLQEALVRKESTGSMGTHKEFQDSEALKCGYGKRLNLEQARRKSVLAMVEHRQVSDLQGCMEVFCYPPMSTSP